MASASVQTAYQGVEPTVRQFISERTKRMLIDGKWVAAAHRDGLVQECEDLQNRGDRLFRPLEGLTRAEAACMLVKAKGLVIP